MNRASGFVLCVVTGWVLALAGCASPPPVIEVPPALPPPATPVSSEDELVKTLGLERPPEQLGAIERTFNSCTLKPDQPCAPRFVTLVHFQLLCRETEGTVSDTPVDLRPITTDDLRWNALNFAGRTRTDERGYGEIVALSDRSLLAAHVTLRMNTHFVGVTLGEITKVVLPSNFCNKR